MRLFVICGTIKTRWLMAIILRCVGASKASNKSQVNGNKGAGRGGRANGVQGDARSYNADLAASGESRGGRSGKSGKSHRHQGGGRNKRDYDRHDGTGRGHETEKRHGTGRGNWGAEGDEVKDLNDKLALDDNEEAGDVEPVEEPEKQMTLEEYEAMMADKKASLNQVKEAAFKADEQQFAGMKTFQKVEEEVDLSLNKNAKVYGASKIGRERERKEKGVVKEVGFRIESAEEQQRARGGGRGGRGGRGPRGPKRGGRGDNRRSQNSINVQDKEAFPSLG